MLSCEVIVEMIHHSAKINAERLCINDEGDR